MTKFSDIAIIGGVIGKPLNDVEVILISISKDSCLQINSSIPTLPKALRKAGGTQLPNGDLLISGGHTHCRGEYYFLNSKMLGRGNISRHYKDSSNQWKRVGIMRRAKFGHSSILINGRLFTSGGCDSSLFSISNHEEFSMTGGLKERKEMPIALSDHTATIFGNHSILICGGKDSEVSKTTP